MIQSKTEPLEHAKAKQLMEWLEMPALDTFKAVVESYVRANQLLAVKHGMESGDPQARLSEAALADAKKYQHCLDVIEQIEKFQSFNILKVH